MISEFDGIADDIPPLPGDLRVVSASKLTVPSANRDEPAGVRAVVDPERLRQKAIRPSHLEVYRLPSGGDEWQPLPTETTEDDGNVIVDAETPGFSRFVVAGPPTPEAIGAATETEASVDQTSEPTETPDSGDERTESPESAAESFVLERIGIDRSTAAFVALVAVVAVLARIFIPRRRR